ncbi:ShlB/FhaC/HecB family hemolysin secretion/activation protein [Burkholderia ubonensis]|uniref:ShlB/FhaC/HecB family hemolysin secretion/activation protein n=1 Tax=Burkholderia ubonensis TaxID=101571 RepID=UPI000B0AA12B|nr:hypothetical protein [Burkholderia ubonensis]
MEFDYRFGDRLHCNIGVDNHGRSVADMSRYRAGVEADNLLRLRKSLSRNFLDSVDSNAL